MNSKPKENAFLFKIWLVILAAAQVSSYNYGQLPTQEKEKGGGSHDLTSAFQKFLNWGEKGRQTSQKWISSSSERGGSSSSGHYKKTETRAFSGESDPSYHKTKSYFGEKSHSGRISSGRGSGTVYVGGCTSLPDSPMNVALRCSMYSGCHAMCHRNYQFPNGETELFIICKDGEWQIEGTEWDRIPNCEPICLPACQHNGICIAPNQCDCPENYRGPQCQFENKPCLNPPPTPTNSMRKCSALSCTVQCISNHQFPDGSTITNMVCKDGNWLPSRPDWVSIPDCEVICQPPCLNGGICLSFNMCQCPQDFRGPQCQYNADSCSAQKLGFNGGYNCTSSGTLFSCSLSCPIGVEFESPPVPVYTCDYATGLFSPSPIPQCKYGSHFKVITSFGNSSYEKSSSHRDEMRKYGKGIKDVGVSQGMIPQTFIPDVFVIEEKKPRSGSCFTWGNSHYKTFDGKVYDFTSSCLYTFVRDAVDNTFSVSLSNNKGCYSAQGCYKNITVFIEDREYVLALDAVGDAMMALNGFQRIAIPSRTREFTVESVAHFVILSLHSCGVTIRWDTKDFVIVDVSEKMWNKTAGLCGRIDGHTENDLLKKDGSTPASILEFVNSWEVHELGNECDDSPSDLNSCSRDTIQDVNLVSKAEQFCHKLLNDPKFDACRKVVNVIHYYEACKWDYCGCEKSNSVECGCQAISVYVQECVKNGVVGIADWRDEMTCPITCEHGKVYTTCGPAVQETCGTVVETLGVSSAEPGSCVEGCFCPTGTLLNDGKCIPRSQCPCQLRGKQFPAGETVPNDCNTCKCEDGKWACTQVQCGARCASVGDPHYTTFDGRHYNFMGKCSYYLVKGDNYSIEAENVACAGSISEAMNFPASIASGLPSCTKMLTIHYDAQTIKLKQNREVSINGEEVTKVPYVHHGIHIRMVSSIFLLVELPNGLEVWWDGMTRAYVDAPAHLQGKTKGLCGTFNQNQKDDFLTPEGDVEQSAISFANKWKTSDNCADLPEKFLERPCDVNVHKKAIAESHCQKLKDVFQVCHWLIDPEPYYQDCLYDVCSCEGKVGPCLCPILSAYAKECALVGFNLDWRVKVRECGIHCPGNQKYQVCGNTCTRSCFDISNQVGDAPCKRKCVEGCNCPEGETLDSRGECIPISACPCVYQGIQFKPGHKIVMPGARESQLCVCKNAIWDCHHATEQDMKDYPSSESLHVTCSSVNNEEFTSCESAEPVTCKNMHKPPSHTPAKCTTGCKCKKGYVLDTYSKKCIKPSECPCHHGGRSYGELEKIQEDCNTCTCSSGKWNCTESACAGICSAWGESHFKTFDGKIFDFHGSCDYVFAKGKIDPQNVFEVMIQNVPCGSSGIACSKSVTLKVGSGDKAESITFSKDRGLPSYSGLKRIIMRQAGLFVFAEVADLGIVLQWDKGTRIHVKANPSWKNKIRGLCGNYNDNELDDFMTPSGGISEISPVVFGDSWKVHQYCPETYEVKDTCVIHPSRKVWALQKCGILKSEVFQPCHSEVPLDPYLERCIFDTCGCDMGGDCECLCTAIAAYAQECNLHGVPIKWRSQELCPMQCDESCAHYSPCVQTCPQQTCDNQYIYKSLTYLCNEDSCVEGCELKPCPEGEVYQSLEDLKCVPLSSCKTVCMTIGNKTYFEGDKIEGDDCHSCFCSRHEKTCKGKPCSTTPEYTTVYSTTPEYTSTSKYTTTSEKSTTVEKVPTSSGDDRCTTGWSPWISNDKPEGLKKPTDIEEISTIRSHMVKKHQAICEPQHMKKIECRVVGTHTHYKDTGQNVLCSLEKGLICDPLTEKGKIKSCLDYEIRVYCSCEETTIAPTTTSTVSPPASLAPYEVMCHTGWSPWMSNDRPVKFARKSTDIEEIPNSISSESDASCEKEKMTRIECRTVGTEKNFDETGQNVTCNLEEGLVCHPHSKGGKGSSCLDYEIRVFCLCETETMPALSTTTAIPITSSAACQDGLGMETGAIQDDQISVSSISTPGHLGNHARLHGNGAWIPASFQIPNEWIQVDLLNQKEITGVIIQGNPLGKDWVKTFEIQWSNDGEDWNSIRNEDDGPPKEFMGNTNEHTPKKVLLDEPLYAQYIKVIPTDFHNRISLRLEILGCDIKETTTTSTTKWVTPTVCDPANPNRPHETDCYIFYQCVDGMHGTEEVKKTCGPHMMYNPETQVCDWPANVKLIRPDCSEEKVPVPCKEGWTEWMNVSNPRHGNGDHETLVNIKRHLNKNICGSDEHIMDIECKYLKTIPRKSEKKTKTSKKGTGKVEYQLVDYEEARQVVICRKDVGLLCNNNEQWSRMCMDYSVRFLCGCEGTTTTTRTTTTTLKPEPSTVSNIPVCPPGKVWRDCAVKCNQVCHHFDSVLSQKGLCSNKYECVSGCVDEHAKSCPNGFYWRDYDTCLEIGDCTCVSHSGIPVKPGEAFKESECEVCQCENNAYECDKSACQSSTSMIYTVTEPHVTFSTPESLLRCDVWTHWYDRSDPEGNDGDFESIEILKQEYHNCSYPSEIQCATVDGDIPYSETGDEVTCDLKSGLQCYNMNNIPGGCKDYKVRIFCPCEIVTPSVGPTTVTGPYITPAPCDRWSDWINDSDKLKRKEMEHEHKTLEQLHEMGFCRDGEVVEIECRDVKTGSNYAETWDVGVSCTLENGLVCRNVEQTKGHHCRDYKIRYFCSCSRTSTTTVTTIIKPSVTPPPECDGERFIPLINGPYPLSDAAFSASSTNTTKHGPQSARLQSPYSTESGLGWIPLHHNKDQFLQVDLGKDEPVYGITVQGSGDISDMYVTSYHVLHSEDGHTFKYAGDDSGNPKLFHGPVDSFKPIEEIFVEPFEARYVRVNPQTWKNGISLKVDLIGCGEVPVTATTTWIPRTTSADVMCKDEMGLEKGLMHDAQIEVSSAFEDGVKRYHAPNVRLNKPQTEFQGGAWIPATNSINEWVKFDFLEPRNLTGVVTQGQNGGDAWVESFKIMYSHDGKVWNPVITTDGTEKEFIANFNADTPQENYFERPIQAQYLKIIPLTWHNNIAIRAEVLGCFLPYPAQITYVPQTTTEKFCKPCPNLPSEKLEDCGHCSTGLFWDGSSCVNKSECQCYVGHIPYSVGAVYTTEDCQQCICKIGGVSSCHVIKCPKCEKDLIVEMSPQCGCVCKPCPVNTRICPTSGICIAEELWCNGIEDCPDDEVACVTTPTSTVATTSITECPIPMCPPGQTAVVKQLTLEFEEPYAKMKGTKGRKGAKGGFKGAKGKPKKIISACPVYECVLEETRTSKPCPLPYCPDGFDVQPLEIPEGASDKRCPQFKCVLKPPEEAVCNMNGRSFETFDGMDYNFDICHHVLATDSLNGKWSVQVHKNCSSCPSYLVIKQDLHTVILNKDILVKYGRYTYTREQAKKIGYKNNQFEISKVGDVLHFKSNRYGFWVNWDGKTNARVEVSSKLLNSISGLCGYYSNDKDDDRQMPDGSVARTYKEFGDSWAIDGFETCEAKVCPVELQNKAWEICSLSKKKPFMVCNEVMNVDKFISQCVETACLCLEEKHSNALKEGKDLGMNWEDECRCDALLSFATQCKEKEPSFDLNEWRVVHSCPALCPPGEVYKDCFVHECEPSCRTLMMENSCPIVNGTCFPGCFCSDGLVRKGDLCVEPNECRDCSCDCFGDPHYLTFDRSNYTFNGNCTYVAARDIKPGGKHDFQVLATNRECIEKTEATCTHAVTILYGDHYIYLERIEKDGEIAVILDGKTLKTFPHSNEWSKLERLGGKEVTVLIPSIQLEVSYFFDSYAFVIHLPSHLYGDKTEGLCGNCNKNKKDDLKRSDGTVTDDIEDFGKSWLTKLPPELGFGEERDCQVPVIPPCPLLPPDENPCLNVIMDENRFGECHPVVDPAPYVESCTEDICHTSDKKRTICQTLEAYARECAREGICINWKVEDLCPYECPSGLVYHPCGSGCLETCENHESFRNKSSLCSMSSIDGCYCPTGKVWKENKCVEVSMCRACDEEGHFSGDVWNPSECEECSCEDSKVTCKVKVCPAVESICDSSSTPVKVSESEDECCPKYICVPSTTPSPPCEESQKPDCGYGQEMKITTSISGCREYICVCVPSEKCEELFPTLPVEPELGDEDSYDPGLEYKVDRSGCCPKLVPKCDLSLCPPEPVCPLHHTMVKLPTPESKCCPDYSCSPSSEVCIYEHEYTSGEELEANEGEPIKSFKKLGETWHDGPCKECKCIEEEEEDFSKSTKGLKGRVKGVKGGRTMKKVFKASCQTIRCPSADEHPDSAEYVLKEVPVPGKCCPEIVRTACQDEGKVYQVGKEWSQPGEHCISHQCVLSTNASLVIKQFKIQHCNRECDEGWKYQEPPPHSEKCCGQCKQVACQSGGRLHPVGSSWVSSDLCTTYYCREVDGIVHTQSVDIKCPTEERLYEDFKVEVLPIEGSCCNKTYKVACLIGEHELKEGETFMVSKCKKVYCALGADNELSKQEIIETCNKECQQGWEYIEPVLDSEKCCGECKQVACITEDNTLILPGSKWTTNAGCTTHICEQKGDQLQISTSEEKCPAVDDCPPENVFYDKCCKRCNVTEKCPPQGMCTPVDMEPELTVGVIDERDDFHGRCINANPVPGFKECKGNCHSSTFFDLRSLTHQANCRCCQATTTKSITVAVTCEDGYSYEKKVTTPTGCSCNTCAPEKIRSPLKTGTKSGYKPFSLKDAEE